MNCKNISKLTKFLCFTLCIFPLQVFAYSNKIIAGGDNIGIKVNADKVMIVGLYQVDNVSPGKDAGLRVGDKIDSINNEKISNINEMVDTINKDPDKTTVTVGYIRNEKLAQAELHLVKQEGEIYKTGLYVKDAISGIGTLTFIDPASKIYGALGHEIIEGATGQKIEIKDGQIFKSTVTGIEKSRQGEPGEKNAKFYSDKVYGTINENAITGIFGEYTDTINQENLYEVAQPSEITTGEAEILTVIEEEKVEPFKINITKLSTNKDQLVKNILFEITDQRLLDKTGGVVQGMSGSPIIQNGKICGAVTHVVVKQATQGYGIYITNMLEESEK